MSIDSVYLKLTATIGARHKALGIRAIFPHALSAGDYYKLPST